MSSPPTVAAAPNPTALTALQAPANDDPIEPQDNNESDNESSWAIDSAVSIESGASSTASLASNIKNYRIENGRQYHAYKDGVYLLPNDEPELDRLDLHHHVTSLVLEGNLYLAPLNHPQRVLDLGAGTGIWAIDFADENPGSSVIGVDLSATQPEWIPHNLEFQVDDVEDQWTFSSKFDYIHIRSLSGAIKDWKGLLQQAYDNLNPGGWIEIQEWEVWVRSIDDTIDKAVTIKQWQEGLIEASDKINRPFLVAASMRPWLEETGFVGVQEWIQKYSVQDNVDGLYQQAQMLEATSSYGAAHFTRVLGWSKEEYSIMAAKLRTEFRNPAFHLYSNFYDVWGCKPA